MQRKCNRCGKLFSPVNYADRECPECLGETEQKATAIYGEQEIVEQEKEYVKPSKENKRIACEYCGELFLPPTKTSRFCSRQCASRRTAKVKKERKKAMEEELKAKEALLELLQKASAVQTDVTSSLSEDELKVVYNPDLYTAGGIEGLKVLEAKLTPEQLFGFYIGNAIKYLIRLNFKGSMKVDLEKAHNYTGLTVEHLAKHTTD